MAELDPPDIHHLRAAEGWLELGNPKEALLELDQISATAASFLEVLGARWAICAELKSWPECIQIAVRILECAPESPFGWIHRSFALHELRRTTEARDLLLPAVDKFPQVGTIPYNLACYECQLGNLDPARKWLKRAIRLEGRKEIVTRALEDTDLKSLHQELAALLAGK